MPPEKKGRLGGETGRPMRRCALDGNRPIRVLPPVRSLPPDTQGQRETQSYVCIEPRERPFVLPVPPYRPACPWHVGRGIEGAELVLSRRTAA